MTTRTERKRWCFTINNPTEADYFWDEDAKKETIQYCILQEERGENGTLHIQGFLILKKPQRLSWMKNQLNGRAHWEAARGTNEQAATYCRKEETYTGGIRKEFGQIPAKPEVKKREERKERGLT